MYSKLPRYDSDLILHVDRLETYSKPSLSYYPTRLTLNMPPTLHVTVSGRQYSLKDVWGRYLVSPIDESTNLQIPDFADRFPDLERKPLER